MVISMHNELIRKALEEEWFSSPVATKRMPNGQHDITIKELMEAGMYSDSADYPAGTLVIDQVGTENKLYFNLYPINANSGHTNPNNDLHNWQELQIHETLGPPSSSGRSSPVFFLVEPARDLKYPHGDHLFTDTIDTIIQGQEKDPAVVKNALEGIWLNLSVGMLLGSHLFSNTSGRGVYVNELLALTIYDSKRTYPKNTPVIYNSKIYFSIEESSGVPPKTLMSGDNTPYYNMPLDDIEEATRLEVLQFPWVQFTPHVFDCHHPTISVQAIIEIVTRKSLEAESNERPGLTI
jgi:hypothetical protein